MGDVIRFPRERCVLSLRQLETELEAALIENQRIAAELAAESDELVRLAEELAHVTTAAAHTPAR